MDSETNPAKILFAESQRLGAFVHFWLRQIEIENTYLDNLSGLQIPDPPGNGQLQELAHKTRELLMDEIEERRRGLEKLQAAYKALSNEFWMKEDTSYFEQWGRRVETSLRRIETSTAKVTNAESSAGRLAVEEREENSSEKKERQPQSNVFARLLTIRKEQPHDTPSFLSADSAYRQKVQQLNDEKYIIQKQIVPQTHYADRDRRCIVALRHIVSTFSAVHSDLAQVLNVTSSQLCNVSSTVDALVESAFFAERLDESFTSLMRFTSLVQPYRYTSYEVSSTLRPTTMLFGCPLPNELDGASIGQRAVFNAFEMILMSAADKYPDSLYRVICDAHKQQGDDTKLSALQLEALWDSSQRNGGPGAVDFLANAPSDSLLVYFLTCLPTPFLPISDSEIKKLAKLIYVTDMERFFAEVGNRMGTARRCNLARLFLTLRTNDNSLLPLLLSNLDGIQILTRVSGLVSTYELASALEGVIRFTTFVTDESSKKSLILPYDFIEELKHAGLLT